MRFLLEYVSVSGLIVRLQINQHNYDYAMEVMNEHFEDISEFIGKGHVEAIHVTRGVAYCVHDEAKLMDTPPNLRHDLNQLLGPVVMIKEVVDNMIPEIIGE